jgi:hypothetical protein
VALVEEEQLLPQLVAHLREHRSKLREEWVGRIRDAQLLEAMTQQEMAGETTSVYDNYLEAWRPAVSRCCSTTPGTCAAKAFAAPSIASSTCT